jgi:hypothetical protein
MYAIKTPKKLIEVEALFAGAGVTIEGTVRALVGTAELVQGARFRP